MTMDCLEKIVTQQCVFDDRLTAFSSVLLNTKMTTQKQTLLQTQHGFQMILGCLLDAHDFGGTIYIIGNGGSAAIASHASIDFINMCDMRATALLDPAVTTCISNDYGYDQIYAKQLAAFLRNKDILIAISSSGKSKSIINAVEIAKNRKATVITLSGFSEENPLRQLGDYNLWLNSIDYGQVEIGHAFLLHYITDYLRDCMHSKNEQCCAEETV